MLWLSLLIATATAAATAAAQPVEPILKEENVYGRPAFVLENGLIRVAALKGGGHLAEVRLLSPDPKKNINPMRVPHYPTIDPTRYDDARHDRLYGTTPHKWLHSGYMGHLLCFPFYGPPSSDDEAKALLGNHGEAPIVEWKKVKVERKAGALVLWYAAELPRTQYRVERAITLARGAKHLLVEEWVENLTNYDRPFQWMQHATFGPPFVEPGKTYLDTSATRGLTAGSRPGSGSLQGGTEFYWPRGIGSDGKPADLRPMQPKPNAGTYYAMQMDPNRQEQFFTLSHSDYQVLIGYLFPTAQNPWLADWQENRSNQTLPWSGQAVARGIEFGNSPFAEGLRKAVDRAQLFGIPSYQWIGARQRLKNQFTIFLEEIPLAYRGVVDARSTPAGIEILPRR